MSENELLDLLLTKICQKLKWEHYSDWTNYHYKQLETKVFEETKMLIHARTINRLVTKLGIHKPQIYTKNALSRFLGHKDWEDFRSTEFIQKGRKILMEENFSNSSKLKYFVSRHRNWFYLSVFGIFSLLVFYFLFNNRISPLEDSEFQISDSVGFVPFSYELNYNLKDLSKPGFINLHNLSQYNVIRKSLKLDPNGFRVSGYINYPGIYQTNISQGNDKIKFKKLRVYTQGWMKFIHSDQAGIIENKKLKVHAEDSILFSDNENLSFKENYVYKDLWIDYVNYKKTNIDGNNFNFSAVISNLNNSVDCNDVIVRICGDSGSLKAHFSSGCFGKTKDHISDIRNNKLKISRENFDFDTRKSFNLVINNIDKHVIFYKDGNVILDETYKESLGEICGINFKFLGNGLVKKYSLTSLDGKLSF